MTREELYLMFHDALQITDMINKPNPFVEKCVEISDNHAREGSIGFGEFIHTHCDWVVDQGGYKDIWGWETDLREYPGLYTTDQLYDKYLETLKPTTHE